MGDWYSFPDGQPPVAVFEGWRQLRLLPAGAKKSLWQMIWLALDDASVESAREALQGFCQQFGVNGTNVLSAVRACDIMLRQAAAVGLSAEHFRTDLLRLASGEPAEAAIELLMTGYGQAFAILRQRLLESTLAEHGNVLVGFDWRVDRLDVSSHGRFDGTPVAHLRLRYRHDDKSDHLNLQLTPDAIVALREFLSQFNSDSDVPAPGTAAHSPEGRLEAAASKRTEP